MTVTTFLVPESTLEELALESRRNGVSWSTRAEPERIVVTVSGGTSMAREGFVAALEERLGTLLCARTETTAHERLIEALRTARMKLVLVESCTGGLISKYVTDVPGSSEVFWGGLVTYDNEAKERLLGVKSIERHGAVSPEVASEMALGALDQSGGDVALSVTGIAGPGGGTEQKPVGTVHMACAVRGRSLQVLSCHFPGSRGRIRTRTAIAGLLLCYGVIQDRDVDSDPIRDYI